MIWIQEAELTHDGDDVELPSDECLEVAVAAPVPDLGLVVDISLLQTRELQIHPLKSELEAVLLDATQSCILLSRRKVFLGGLCCDLQSLVESNKNTLDWSFLDKLCHHRNNLACFRLAWISFQNAEVDVEDVDILWGGRHVLQDHVGL